MDYFKKGSTRYVFGLSLAFFVCALFIAETAVAGTFRDEIPVPFSQIVWDHPDVSHWPITSDMPTVYIEGDYLMLHNSKEGVWPPYPGVPFANASAWAIHRGRDGSWRANNFDHMRINQHQLHEHAVGSGFDGWTPRAGETVYFFVSGQARPSYPENVHERTNVVKYVWHGAAGMAVPACETVPVIHSFTATPSVVVGGQNEQYNVELDWDISDVEGLILVSDNGESGETTEHDAKINGVDLRISKTHTFKLTAKGCTPEDTWPSKTLTVEYRDVSLGGVNLLLSK